ncbi:hypothetical protein LCI18_001041 [Fusarium solani-melongenae]|uniref:Uncharacterized protein n=1 Tax=Fusarium solani subsp. cucurbitae TaxID=2747967 RepID=A0ACD3YMH9_FUSSC|nr:hypothetical protein LCI18_001041 [Fusarium solani-melongenae]
MCIKVDRWFYCPVLGQGPPVPPERGDTNNIDNFWTYWDHGETAGLNEQHKMNLPTFPGYHYVHHIDERWIRCAMTHSRVCQEYPLEIRTELYNIPCPDCSQDDSCVLSAQPIRTYKNPSPNMTPVVFAHIADAYAYEIITIITSFLRIEFKDLALEEADWNVYQRGLYCTQERNHIIGDRAWHPYGPLRYICAQDCACTARPWAHNASRAARNQNATNVRIRAALEWFYYAYTDEEPSWWTNDYFGHIPNQLWLNMHEEGTQRYIDLIAQITKAVYDLNRLGPTIQTASEDRRRFEQANYQRCIRLGQSTATRLITLPCLDPGITTEFLDLLMRDHFLTALCPHIDPTNNQIYTLACQKTPNEAMKMLLYYSRRIFGDNDTRLEAFRCGVQESELVNALGRNRTICHRNARVKKQVAEGFALACVVNSQHAAASTQTCPICADDFDDARTVLQIPTNLRAVEMPCCHQFMHVRCLKGSALHWEKCPLCNKNLKEVGLSMERFAPDKFIQQEVLREDLPEGMIRRPNASERELVEVNLHRIIEYVRDRLQEERTALLAATLV